MICSLQKQHSSFWFRFNTQYHHHMTVWFLISWWMKKILETRKGSGSGNWKHDTFSFGLLWTKCRLSLIWRSLILLIVEKWAENVECSFPCFDTPFIWPILFINVTKLICTRFSQSFIFGMLASDVVWKDAYDYQSMNLSNLIKIMVVIFYGKVFNSKTSL
jgi:hypothetical protein